MKSKRLPRFTRARAVAPLQLTERDREIIRLFHRHRFLRSPHILALIAGSQQQTLRRLQSLYHHGYLERPYQQIEYYQRGGSRHIVYGVGDKGAEFLKQESGDSFKEPRWGEKNRSIGRVYLEHALLVSDFMVALELGCRQTGRVKLVMDRDLLLARRQEPRDSIKWSVKTKTGVRLGVIPDRVFALEFAGQDGKSTRAFFFLEADRGTMPVTRRSLSQTSFFRKFLAYEATWAQGIHRSQFGFHRFRVLTVTSSNARVKSLIDACARLKSGHGLFLFTDAATFRQQGDIFNLPWKTGRQGEYGTLLD